MGPYTRIVFIVFTGLDSRIIHMNNYGQASKYRFDDPSKWYTEQSVPLLDEHVMTNEDGSPVATVDKTALEQIAHNNNKRIFDTGDPATLILGHTDDEPGTPEKPAKGFVVNYRVKPFKRDPKTGQVIYAIHGDFKVRHHNKHILEEYPRRSVELWWNKKELDPIALLGGTSPERDLGVVIRKARLKHLSLLGGTVPDRDLGNVLRFSRRGNDTIEHYSIDNSTGVNMTKKKKYAKDCGSMVYDDMDMDTNDIGGDGDSPDNDSVVARMLQSKMFKQALQEAIMSAFEQLSGGEGVGGGEQPPPMEGDGMEGQPLMEGEGGYPPQPEEEDRMSHGDRPVQFEDEDEEEPEKMSAVTSTPGPSSTSVPAFGGSKKVKPTTTMFSRNDHTKPSKGTPMEKNDPQIIRMQSTIEQLQLKLSRADAKDLVNQLKNEGIIFGSTPEDAAKGEADDIEYLAYLNQEEQQYHVNEVIRKRYARKKVNPTTSVNGGVARYTRASIETPTGSGEEEFEPTSPQEASDFADLVSGMNPQRVKLNRQDATKFMMKRRSEGHG